MKKTFLFLLIIIILFHSTSCKAKEPIKYEASFLLLFNTITEVVAFADTKEEFETFSRYIYDSLAEYHRLYDKYNLYDGINNIKTINDNAGIAPVKVDNKIIELLSYCKDMYLLSDGTVNVAMGSVLELWHDYRSAGIDNPEIAALPPMDELILANQHTDINKLIIDKENSTVFLEDEKMRLDVGAIAKGYAAEQIVQSARKNGYTDFLLNVGGNTVASGRKGTNRELWNVGIQNPDKYAENNILYVLSLTNLSLVASGEYERYYTVEGKRYHHIIDPKTLMPSAYFTAVSIVSEDSALADTLSTAIFNMPYEEGRALIDSLGNTEALWVFFNGEVRFSNHFEELIKADSNN